ncbi:MAG TPA: SurA N-terminal domain-containing protein [Myxococcaceae bacterium]|nr:SurA N-terminal domain-containing protein [Myxococcaceae bacterium]
MKFSYDWRRLVSLFFIVAIAVVFTLSFGPGSRGCEAPVRGTSASAAAVVNGKEIPLTEFRLAYRNALNGLRAQGITESLARQVGVHRQVLERIVNTELLAQAAERHGITASDQELAEILHRNPDFQKDGRFDAQQYRNVLRQYYRKSDTEFERELRRELAAQKMLETVEAAAAVSPDEVKSRFLKEGNRAQVTFVRLAPAMFADKVGAPKPDEIAAFARDHAKEIADYYEANKFAYNQPEQVRARHILIKVEKDAPAEKKADARKRIEDLRKQIVEGGKDFAELAGQHSEDPGSKQQGGDLGFNSADAWVKPFADAAFALKPGEVSAPVESDFGVHLIKVEEKRAAQNKELKQVESEIATVLWKREKAQQLAKAEADKAQAALAAGKDLKALYPPAKEPADNAPPRFTPPTKPEAVETEEFNAAADSIPRLGPAPAVLTDVFARQEAGPLEKPYPLGEAWVVAAVTKRALPSDTEFEKQKETLLVEARRAKEYELREAFLKALRKRGEVKTNGAAVEQALGPATTG